MRRASLYLVERLHIVSPEGCLEGLFLRAPPARKPTNPADRSCKFLQRFPAGKLQNERVKFRS